MKGKIVKRSLALGVLMAFVITGSAMAAELTINGFNNYEIFKQENPKWANNYDSNGEVIEAIYHTDSNNNTVNLSGEITAITSNSKFILFAGFSEAGEALDNNKLFIDGLSSTVKLELVGAIISSAVDSSVKNTYVEVKNTDKNDTNITSTKLIGYGSVEKNQLNVLNSKLNSITVVEVSGTNVEKYSKIQDNHAVIGETIKDATVFKNEIKAAYSNSNLGKVDIENNSITINGGSFQAITLGSAKHCTGEIKFSNNKLYINNGTFDGEVYVAATSGRCHPTISKMIGNELHIRDGIINNNVTLVSGKRDDNGSLAENNKIYISGGEIRGTVNLTSVHSAKNNELIISDKANLQEATLYAIKTGANNVIGSNENNKLIIDGSWDNTDGYNVIKKVGKFDVFAFSNVGKMPDTVNIKFTELDISESKTVIDSFNFDRQDKKKGDTVSYNIEVTSDNGQLNKMSNEVVVSEAVTNREYITLKEAVRVYTLSEATVSKELSNSNKKLNINTAAKIEDSILAGKYLGDVKKYHGVEEKDINEDGSVGSGKLVLDSQSAINASVIAGAYAKDDKEANGGNIVINDDFTLGDNTVDTFYAGYSESGTTNNNTMTVNGGDLQNFNLFGRTENGTGSNNTLTFTAEADTNVKSIKYFDTINLNGGAVTTEEVTANVDNSLTVNVNNANASLTATTSDVTNLTINGSSEVTDTFTDPESGLEELASKVKINGTNTTATVTSEAGTVLGAMSAKVGADGNVVAGTFKEEVNKANEAVAEAGVNLKAHWRAHMNDMNKRMGELRNANGENGVWVRMVRGESEFDGAKAQYNQYQLGYDEKLSVDKRWTVGAAVTFAEGNSNYGTGSTEDDSTAFAVYGSKLNNDGSFVDLIARYARMESDLTDTAGKADYSTNGYSVSAEFGKRFTQENGMWIEPQVELTYGSVDSAEYKLGGKTVYVGDMDSVIGRVGFALGKNIKQGNVYARASYLYDFDGETETSFSDSHGNLRTIKDDLGGGWWEVGVGANINLSKSTYIYADVEKTFGGKVDTNWQWNLGVRYSF